MSPNLGTTVEDAGHLDGVSGVRIGFIMVAVCCGYLRRDVIMRNVAL